MIIEKRPLKLTNIDLDEIRTQRQILSRDGSRALSLREDQAGYLEHFLNHETIEQTVEYYLDRGVFPSFRAMRLLLEFLATEHFFLDDELCDYFQPESASMIDMLVEKVFGDSKRDIKIGDQVRALPFFRTLNAELATLLLKHSSICDAERGTVLCRHGARQRSMFILLEGEAAVYKDGECVAVLNANSLFGEVGFFLGQPRTATVMMRTKGLLLQIRYVPDVFDHLFHAEQALELQQRHLIIQSLLKSEMFKDVPDDCFDALIFAGSLVHFAPKKEIIMEGDEGAECYIIMRGQVAVSQKDTPIRQLGPGDCFGEVALIMTGGIRSASVRAETEIVALKIKAAKFYKLLAENFMLACAFEKIALRRVKADRQRQG